MTLEERLIQINALLPALQHPALAAMLTARIAELTNKLIAQDNEQTRGAIKELRALLNLPDTLQHERDGITAGFSEQSDPAP